jgi:hypothetical protein
MSRIRTAAVDPLIIDHLRSRDLPPSLRSAIYALCSTACATDTAPFFASLGDGDHLLGYRDREVWWAACLRPPHPAAYALTVRRSRPTHALRP